MKRTKKSELIEFIRSMPITAPVGTPLYRHERASKAGQINALVNGSKHMSELGKRGGAVRLEQMGSAGFRAMRRRPRHSVPVNRDVCRVSPVQAKSRVFCTLGGHAKSHA